MEALTKITDYGRLHQSLYPSIEDGRPIRNDERLTARTLTSGQPIIKGKASFPP